MSETSLSSPSPLIVALDFPSAGKALSIADKLDPASCRLKIGKELFTRSGPAVIDALTSRGFDIFLDLKFHDIPNTVAKAVRAAVEAGVWMLNVHASGGSEMMQAARKELDFLAEKTPLLIGVTVLTSMNQEELQTLGVQNSLEEQVQRLALLAKKSGLHGVVCSALEAQEIKRTCGDEFITVTPGIRPKGASVDDQKRIMTPSEAIASGSDYLVVGRPITAASDPMQVVGDILQDIASL